MYNTRYSAYVHQSQNYDQIKASCLQRRCLFEDPEFPANSRSVFGSEGPSGKLSKWNGNITWKRPVELVRQPHFIADGVSRFDVIQGELGNCWFIAAVANLTLHRDLFVQVVPYQSNAFDPAQYCGVFQFRFWQYGAWVTVVIDDRLPCDRRGELLFLHSSDKREFWSALLEKAYAKFHGSYQALAGGTPGEALQEFSGGIIETIDFDESTSPSSLWPVLKKAYDRNSLITCVLSGRRGYYEEKTRDGLVRGHAYSVTNVQHVPTHASSHPHQLVRIRNPWGDHYEWKGAWGDGAREWSMVDHGTKARLGYNPGQDGEFWMSIHDFRTQFTRAEVCHVSPDDPDPRLARPWNKYIVEGAWIRGRSAGGCMNHSSFAMNPQYFFRFVASDADGDADKCTVIVSLIQKSVSRSSRDLLSIGFRMFKAPPGNQPLDSRYLQQYADSRKGGLSSGAYTDAKEVSARFEVDTGHYCIIPSTFEPGDEGEFLLRVFSEPESGGYNQGGGGVLDSFRNMRITNNSPSYPGANPAPPVPAAIPTGCPYPAYPSYGPSSAPAPPAPVPASPYPSYPQNPNPGPYPTYPVQPAAAPGYPAHPPPHAGYAASPYPVVHGPPPPGNCPYPTGNANPFPGPGAAPVAPGYSYATPSAGYAVNSSPNHGSAPYEQQPALNPAFSGSGSATGPAATATAAPPYPYPHFPNASPQQSASPACPYPPAHGSTAYPAAPGSTGHPAAPSLPGSTPYPMYPPASGRPPGPGPGAAPYPPAAGAYPAQRLPYPTN